MTKEFSKAVHQALYDQAYQLACQRAEEEGDVDIEYDYTLMDVWTDEYYRELCADEGLDPHPDFVL